MGGNSASGLTAFPQELIDPMGQSWGIGHESGGAEGNREIRHLTTYIMTPGICNEALLASVAMRTEYRHPQHGPISRVQPYPG